MLELTMIRDGLLSKGGIQEIQLTERPFQRDFPKLLCRGRLVVGEKDDQKGRW